VQPAAYLADIAEPKADRRKLTVVMHADMVGYSRLIGLDDAGTLVRLRRMRQALIDPAIARNGGTIRQTAGDSLLVVFDSIDGAMQSAIAIQRGAGTFDKDAQPDQLIRFRIGIALVHFDDPRGMVGCPSISLAQALSMPHKHNAAAVTTSRRCRSRCRTGQPMKRGCVSVAG
jgi:adenylate cyclase